MKTAEKILIFYNELDLKFHELFFEVLKNFNEAAIHDFRVVIKKQIAFFHLLEWLDPRFQAKETEALFFRIFKNAGAIRKVHIERNILTNKDLKVDLDAGLLEKLDKRLAEKTERYIQHDNKKDLEAIDENRQLIRNRIHHIPGNKLNVRLKNYFAKLLRNLKKLAADCKKNETAFHDLRISLKELFYNLNLINRLSEKVQLTPNMLKYLDKLQTLLGEWHDVHLTLKHISALENPDFDQLINILKKENNRYVKRIKLQLKTFETVISSIKLELSSFVK